MPIDTRGAVESGQQAAASARRSAHSRPAMRRSTGLSARSWAGESLSSIPSPSSTAISRDSRVCCSSTAPGSRAEPTHSGPVMPPSENSGSSNRSPSVRTSTPETRIGTSEAVRLTIRARRRPAMLWKNISAAGTLALASGDSWGSQPSGVRPARPVAGPSGSDLPPLSDGRTSRDRPTHVALAQTCHGPCGPHGLQLASRRHRIGYHRHLHGSG